MNSQLEVVETLLKALKEMAILQGDSHPASIYSKGMLKRKFRVSENRLARLVQELESHPERIENGDNPMAPLRVWCSILKTIPQNPRPRKSKAKPTA